MRRKYRNTTKLSEKNFNELISFYDFSHDIQKIIYKTSFITSIKNLDRKIANVKSSVILKKML